MRSVFSVVRKTSLFPHNLGCRRLGWWQPLYTPATVTWFILKLTDVLVGNRVDEDQEQEGLDLVAHNERGYDL